MMINNCLSSYSDILATPIDQCHQAPESDLRDFIHVKAPRSRNPRGKPLTLAPAKFRKKERVVFAPDQPCVKSSTHLGLRRSPYIARSLESCDFRTILAEFLPSEWGFCYILRGGAFNE